MRRAIAIDFDGCLCTNEYPRVGRPNWRVISLALVERAKGAGLILWTCREGKELQEAIDACQEWGLDFDAINESLPEWVAYFGNRPRKVGATEYWDDRAVKMMVENEHTNTYQVKDIINIVKNSYLICPSEQARNCLEALYELSARLMKKGGS